MVVKILIVIENLIMGGLKRVTTVVGNELAQQADVAYYSLAQTPAFYPLQAPLLVAPHPVAPTVTNYFGDRPLDVYQPQLRDLLATLATGHYDCVVLPGGLLVSFAPAIKASFPRINVIAWIHNNFRTYFDQYYVQMQPELQAGLTAADTVVVLTDSDLVNYAQFNPHTVKIYNPQTLGAAGQRADLQSHTIAFTGRIDIQHKGIDYLLELARQLPRDWQIAIAGHGKPADMATFHWLQRELGVSHRILYRGALQDQALRQHYQRASIFVMTSRWEGMPLVMGEAMAFGLPVAAMENTGSAEYLQQGRHGLLTAAKDVAALSQAVNTLIESPVLRQQYAYRSLERIKDFQMPRIMGQWQAILTQSA